MQAKLHQSKYLRINEIDNLKIDKYKMGKDKIRKYWYLATFQKELPVLLHG